MRVGAAGKETILVIEQRKLSVLKEEVRNELIWRRRKQVTASSCWLGIIKMCYLAEGNNCKTSVDC